MSETDKVFEGSIPDIYDEYLVPLIFESFASDMARRVSLPMPEAVLETAAGSGAVTRALAPFLGRSARCVVTDLNPPIFLARTPHGYYDKDEIYAELPAAGFSNVVIETLTETSRTALPQRPAIAYCQGTPLRNEIEARDALRLAEVTNHAAMRVEERFGAGPVSGQIRGHVIVATV